jgi:mono/diheme cytochrome c family protein
MKVIKSVLFLASATFLAACTNNSPNDLVDSTPILDNVTYTNSVKAIMDSNCISCHGTVPTNGAPNSLTTYENVRDAVLNMGLINRLNRNIGDNLLMPLGGPKLPQNRIDAVVKWQNQNFQQ